MSTSPAAVINGAASAIGSMRAKKAAPETCSPERTSRFVRFDPGRNSEEALAMNTLPYRKGVASTPRRRAASTSTGVRKTTEVSRLSSAVTTATSAKHASSRTTGGPARRTSREAAASNRPSRPATSPISSSPATSTNGGHACASAARAWEASSSMASGIRSAPASRRYIASRRYRLPHPARAARARGHAEIDTPDWGAPIGLRRSLHGGASQGHDRQHRRPQQREADRQQHRVSAGPVQPGALGSKEDSVGAEHHPHGCLLYTSDAADEE